MSRSREAPLTHRCLVLNERVVSRYHPSSAVNTKANRNSGFILFNLSSCCRATPTSYHPGSQCGWIESLGTRLEYAHTHTYTLSHTHSLTHTHTYTLSHTHTHTHSHTMSLLPIQDSPFIMVWSLWSTPLRVLWRNQFTS